MVASERQQEATMSFPFTLFAKLGLFAAKNEPDFFDLRLQRTRSREERRASRGNIFRNLASH